MHVSIHTRTLIIINRLFAPCNISDLDAYALVNDSPRKASRHHCVNVVDIHKPQCYGSVNYTQMLDAIEVQGIHIFLYVADARITQHTVFQYLYR